MEQVREYVAHKLWELVVLKSDLASHLRALKQYFLLAKGEFYHLFLEEAASMMTLPPVETSERDINQGPFLNAASRLGLEDNPFFKQFKLRLRSFKFRYENFTTIPGLTLIGACHLLHGTVVMKSNGKHTGAVWHTLKQQVANGFKLAWTCKFQLNSGAAPAHGGHQPGVAGPPHIIDRASAGSVMASPKYFYRPARNTPGRSTHTYELASPTSGYTQAIPSQEKAAYNPAEPKVELEMAKQFGSSASATLILQTEKEVIGWKNVAPICTLELNEYICVRAAVSCPRLLGPESSQVMQISVPKDTPVTSTVAIYACKNAKTIKKTLMNLIAIEGQQQRKLVAKEEGEELKLAETDISSTVNLADGEMHQISVEYENEQLVVSVDSGRAGRESAKVSVGIKLSDFVKLDNGTCFVGICNESGSVNSSLGVKSWWFSSSNLPYHKDSWNGLSLEYEPVWPLHLILSPEVLEKYNNLFRFLLPFRRIQILLHKEWMANTRLMTSGKHGKKIRKLMNLRGEMAFFVHNVMAYFQVDVLEVQWTRLEDGVGKSQDFEEVRKLHDVYLTNITSQCLIHMSKLVKALEELLHTCMKMCFFLDRVEASEEFTSDMEADYGQIKQEFEQQSAAIFRMMSNVKKNQSSPFLSQLLLRLDYNKYYSELAARLERGKRNTFSMGIAPPRATSIVKKLP